MPEVATISQPLHLIEEHLVALMETAELTEQVAPEKLPELQAEIAKYIDLSLSKRDRVAQFLAHCDAQALAADAEIERLQERKKMFTKTAERLERYVVAILEERGLKKLEGHTSTLSLRACPTSVEITDEAALPAQFVVQTVSTKPDKAAIKRAIQAGETVPGADLRMGKFALRIS